MTTMRTIGLLTSALASVAAAASSADARSRSRRYVAPPPETEYVPRPYREASEPFNFYPESIEGGVRGNLPFNNQIRKFRDPLNANGAGG